MISLREVSHTYPDRETPAVGEVSLDIGAGELVLVAGPSGGGKSTMLRMINGLVPHFHGGRFSGRVVVDGLDTLALRPRDLAGRVGFVGQSPEHHAVATRVEEDIAFTLENLGTEPAAMRKRVEETLDALGIAGLRARRLDSLSGGERQRAAIAAALAAMPAHLVLDEPTSQLDPQSAEEVIGSLLRLRDELGVSVVLAEHRLDRVLQYGDRLVVLEGGRAEHGLPAETIWGHDLGSPIVELSRELGWYPPPLSLREARRLAEGLRLDPTAPGRAVLGDVAAQVAGLGVSFNGRAALNGIDLAIAQGEVVALMGRNGSGKTTLLRSVAGLVRPRRGRAGAEGPVALVPQNPEAILFRRSVAEEIAATLRGRGRRADASAVASEAERFGLERLLERYPRELSGGEQTRVAIAAATAGDPLVVLLDEPTRGMDEPGKRWLLGVIEGWSAEGRAIVLATHDVELAARAATRVVLLAEGELVLDGPPGEALASSLTFSTQMSKVFGDPRILTVTDALAALGHPRR
ncbi:MAG: ABC transporter ATP-binding protein [Actinomycetota bacterium]